MMKVARLFFCRGWGEYLLSLLTFCRQLVSDSTNRDKMSDTDVKAAYLWAFQRAMEVARTEFAISLGQSFHDLEARVEGDFGHCRHAKTFYDSVLHDIKRAGLPNNVPRRIRQLFESYAKSAR